MVDSVWSVGHQPTVVREVTVSVHGREPSLRRQRADLLAMAPQHRIVKHDQPGGCLVSRRVKPDLYLPRMSGRERLKLRPQLLGSDPGLLQEQVGERDCPDS